MPHDDSRVFVVHSKMRPWHDKLYNALYARLRELDVRVTDYSEWSWVTPGGIDDREHERERSRWAAGYRKLNHQGWVKEPHPLLTIALGRAPKRNLDINRSDLARLIAESSLIVLIEDAGQATVSSGVTVELDLLRASGKRYLNVRVCDDKETAYDTSVYPLDDLLLIGGVLAVRRTPQGGFAERDLDVVVLTIALWCDDTPGPLGGSHRQGEPKQRPNYANYSVRFTSRGMFRHSEIPRLVTSDDDHVRRCTFMYIVSCCDPRLRSEVCGFLGRMMMDMDWSSRHIEDFKRFMELMPDIDWTEVVRAIDANDDARRAPPTPQRPWWRFWG